MNVNSTAVAAAIFTLCAFALTYSRATNISRRARIFWLIGISILSLPGASFAFYYTHLLPETSWYYQFRSITGTEFLVIPLGIVGGLIAASLPRPLLILPLLATTALCVVPFIKPIIGPFANDQLSENWAGDVCLQSTGSTCGPASLATVLNHLGTKLTEAVIVERAHTYRNGTEAWYLARIARAEGYHPKFDFHQAYNPNVPTPCIAGVRLGAIGHFIPILEITDTTVTIADPLRGKETLSRAELLDRYTFTGFYLVIHPIDS